MSLDKSLGDLSAKAAELLVYIQGCALCPTNRDMQCAMNLGAGCLLDLLDELEAKGRIRRLRKRARAIEVIPPSHGLRVVYGPGHFERRAAEVSGVPACRVCDALQVAACAYAGCPKRRAA